MYNLRCYSFAQVLLYSWLFFRFIRTNLRCENKAERGLQMLTQHTGGGKRSGGKPVEPSPENTWTAWSFLSKTSTRFYLFGFLLWKTRSSPGEGDGCLCSPFQSQKAKRQRTKQLCVEKAGCSVSVSILTPPSSPPPLAKTRQRVNAIIL